MPLLREGVKLAIGWRDDAFRTQNMDHKRFAARRREQLVGKVICAMLIGVAVLTALRYS